jgi:hypothetical protein
MTQEQKNLLLKDLCGRLPYGVKFKFKYAESSSEIMRAIYLENYVIINSKDYSCEINDIKPYLFPMSSITEEQYNSLYESGILDNCSHNYEYVNPHIYGVSFIFKQFKTYSLELIEWLNKNHFDYRGLISMGLAIDCTNLNIY